MVQRVNVRHHAKFRPAENFVKCSAEENIRSLQVDEKIYTVETPSKSNSQNDPVYASVNAKHVMSPNGLLRARKHFTKNIMVSVAVLKAL